MTLSEKDQERYDRLAALEAQASGAVSEGTSLHGEPAAALGRELLQDALGDPDEVAKAVGGRPRVGGATAGEGASPTLRVRVTAHRKMEVDQLRAQQGMKTDSDVVRAALDEYIERHLQASA